MSALTLTSSPAAAAPSSREYPGGIREPSLTITCLINGVPYTLRPASRSPGSRAFLLHNTLNNTTYRISYPASFPSSFTCTCPDHRERQTACKHISCISRLFSAISLSLQQRPTQEESPDATTTTPPPQS